MAITSTAVASATYKGGDAYVENGQVWVVDAAGGAVAIFDPASGASTSIDSDGPTAIASSDGLVYLGEMNELAPRIRVIDGATHADVTSSPLPATPRAIAAVGDSIWAVSGADIKHPFDSSIITVVEPKTARTLATYQEPGYVAALVSDGPNVFALTATGDESRFSVEQLDADTGQVLASQAVGGDINILSGIPFAVRDGVIYVGTYSGDKRDGEVEAFVGAGLEPGATFPLGNETPSAISVSPDGLMFVATGQMRTKSVVPSAFSIAMFDLLADPAAGESRLGLDDHAGQTGVIAFVGGVGYYSEANGAQSELFRMSWSEPPPSPVAPGPADSSVAKAVATASQADLQGGVVGTEESGMGDATVAVVYKGHQRAGIVEVGYDANANQDVVVWYEPSFRSGCRRARDEGIADADGLRKLGCDNLN
jgi:hypothetical protein